MIRKTFNTMAIDFLLWMAIITTLILSLLSSANYIKLF